jgi:hypothetical protein
MNHPLNYHMLYSAAGKLITSGLRRMADLMRELVQVNTRDFPDKSHSTGIEHPAGTHRVPAPIPDGDNTPYREAVVTPETTVEPKNSPGTPGPAMPVLVPDTSVDLITMAGAGALFPAGTGTSAYSENTVDTGDSHTPPVSPVDTGTSVAGRWTVRPCSVPAFQKVGRVYMEQGDLVIRSDLDIRGFLISEDDLDRVLTGDTGTIRFYSDVLAEAGTARLSTSGRAFNLTIDDQLYIVPLKTLVPVVTGDRRKAPLFVPAGDLAPDI